MWAHQRTLLLWASHGLKKVNRRPSASERRNNRWSWAGLLLEPATESSHSGYNRWLRPLRRLLGSRNGNIERAVNGDTAKQSSGDKAVYANAGQRNGNSAGSATVNLGAAQHESPAMATLRGWRRRN
ncbi:hypothetical protein ElyMa_003038200 [Elysia marginata]|uniref:Uncharacterized protein n=1 Tax=Elysia marginata TaxID=1093978 RepID=A0AAV4IJN0_9GAST|nr:hypothetical protein ElyMa_003038200 [Elysia marginata]